MDSDVDEDVMSPVPWAGASAPNVARPRWLDSQPAPMSPRPLEGFPVNGERAATAAEVPTPSERASGVDEPDATHEPPLPPALEPEALAPARDYEGEIAALEADLSTLRQQVLKLATSAERTRRQVLEACESDVVELAAAIATRIVARELASCPTIYAQWTREALSKLAEQSDLSVLVSADVFEAVPSEAWANAAGEGFTPKVDPKLAPGSCEIRSSVSRIDGSATARIRAIVEALGATEEH